jgi:uncharacterized protein (DUF433 family)
MVDYKNIITIEPGKKSGKACIRGMRFMVSDVLGYLSEGMSIDEIIMEWPELTREDILACLSYSAKNEEKTIILAS